MGVFKPTYNWGGPTICSYLWILGFHMVAIMEEISYKFLQSVWILLNQVVHKESHTAGILFFWEQFLTNVESAAALYWLLYSPQIQRETANQPLNSFGNYWKPIHFWSSKSRMMLNKPIHSWKPIFQTPNAQHISHLPSDWKTRPIDTHLVHTPGHCGWAYLERWEILKKRGLANNYND